jgi:CRP-like cAMP-binding protein
MAGLASGLARESAAGAAPTFAVRGPLALVEAGARTRFLAAARPLFVPRGARVYAAGDGPGGIYGVVSGGIGVEGSTAHLGPRLGHVMRSGGWFGEGPALRGGERRLGYRALEDSRLLTVPLPVLQQLQHENPGVTRLLATVSEISSGIAALAVRELLIPEAPRRIAAVLLRVTGVLDGVAPDDPRGFILSQADLGEMANASRHHVNRVLGDFERRGWVVRGYNHLRLLDVGALSDFAYGEE